MRHRLLSLWCVFGVAPAQASQADVRAITTCLSLQDVACAEQVVAASHLEQGDPVERGMAARVAFYAGNYPHAFDLLSKAVDDGLEGADDELTLYRRSMFATAGWVEVERPHATVRYRPGVDAVLVDDAASVVASARDKVVPLLGEAPPGPTIIEIFPDSSRFIASSSLTKADVESTGAVAISKWTRLLVSSPRALGRGYPWQTTIAHEYVHLIVSHNTADKAPVWLQEGIAKALEGLWQDKAFRLDPRTETLLAKALAHDALVPFREMHPSLAKIKVFRPDGSIDVQASSERASLAYAQLATLIAFVLETGPKGVLADTLARVKAGTDAQAALAQAAQAPSFAVLINGWKAWLTARAPVDRGVKATPLLLDGGSEAEQDPVMSERQDLANRLRLGDLLLGRERYRAALVEYEQAADEEDPNSPLRATRIATAWVGLGDDAQAKAVLEASLADYPDVAETHRILAQLALSAQQKSEAIAQWSATVALDPFRIEDHEQLHALWLEQGQIALARKQAALVEILKNGGEIDPGPPIHERYGRENADETQLQEPDKDPSRAIGQQALAFRVKLTSGEMFDLSAHRGEVVLIDFWATWCGPCVATLPIVSEISQTYAAQGVKVVSVSDEPPEVVARYLQRLESRGTPLRQLIALQEGQVSREWRVNSLPTLFVIDQNGAVATREIGASDLKAIRAKIEELLKHPPPKAPI